MLEIVQPSFELPDTGIKILATGRANQSLARNDFWVYRQMIDSTFVKSWWQKHAALYLQRFYNDIEVGKRPKLVLQAPPQHGKSRMVLTLSLGRRARTRTYPRYSQAIPMSWALRRTCVSSASLSCRSIARSGGIRALPALRTRGAGSATHRCANMLTTRGVFGSRRSMVRSPAMVWISVWSTTQLKAELKRRQRRSATRLGTGLLTISLAALLTMLVF
jgi:hypothetical protein